jgi:hypothetical protein
MKRIGSCAVSWAIIAPIVTVASFSIVLRQAAQVRSAALSRPLYSVNANSGRDWHEFDHVLLEGGAKLSQQHDAAQVGADFDGTETQRTAEQITSARVASSRRRVVLPERQTESGSTERRIVLASSSAGSSAFPGAPIQLSDELESSNDPYANALDGQLNKIEQYQEQRQTNSLEAKFKSMDLQDIVLTLLIPGIVAFAASRWVLNRVGKKVSKTSDETLDSFATEMLYHDGDFQEMELCVKDYQTKLVWMGPAKSDAMLKRYLEAYAKKKTVSPQAIASLSYVFTIFKLSEEKAAQILVALCRAMGTDKISSAGKLLFLGSRILKSAQGKTALQPIKTLIMSTYRDEAVAETLVETSQQYVPSGKCPACVCVLCLENAADCGGILMSHYSRLFSELLPKRPTEPPYWRRVRIKAICRRVGRYWDWIAIPPLAFGKPKRRTAF